MHTFRSNGKLLLTAEYLVLDGALALACPSSYGQSLAVEIVDTGGREGAGELHWKSLTVDGELWFEAHFTIPSLEYEHASDRGIAVRLQKILRGACELNPTFLKDSRAYSVETQLDFPRDWGLGSSSTLLNNIAQWARVDAFSLFHQALTGSAYDIACAQAQKPVLYQITDGKAQWEEVSYSPPFTDQLFFVHLGEKQNSFDEVLRYREQKGTHTSAIEAVSTISKELLNCKNIEDFTTLLTTHEQILSAVLHTKPVKERLFADYPGLVKSLGAWGGDFVLVSGREEEMAYFHNKGYQPIIPYQKMIL